jgi:hypothetical protein
VVVTKVASEVDGYEERKKGNVWYNEECQIKKKKEIKPKSKCRKGGQE